MNNDWRTRRAFYPLNRHYVAVSKSTIVMALLFVFFMTGFLPEIGRTLDTWFEKRNLENDKLMMSNLSAAGNDAASLWLVQHYPIESETIIYALETKGYAQAFYYDGLIKIANGHKFEGENLIKKAADKGEYNAIKYFKK